MVRNFEANAIRSPARASAKGIIRGQRGRRGAVAGVPNLNPRLRPAGEPEVGPRGKRRHTPTGLGRPQGRKGPRTPGMGPGLHVEYEVCPLVAA